MSVAWSSVYWVVNSSRAGAISCSLCDLWHLTWCQAQQTFYFIYLATRLAGSDPNRELNPCPLQWKCGVLNTGPPGNSQAFKNIYLRGFPGGAVVKNPPANAADTGSSPAARAAEQLSPRATTTEPTCHNY